MNRAIVIFGLILAISTTAFARESTEIISARYLGMGGCFVAGERDRTMLFANPAALDRPDGRMITVMGVASTINSKTADVLGFILDHRDDFADISDMSETEQNDFFDLIVREINFKRMNFMLSTVPFGWIQKPLGGALFTDSRISGMAFNGASGTPLVDFSVRQDFGGIVGYSYGWNGIQSFLPNRLSVGASLKYIHRSAYSIRETITELSDGEAGEIMNGTTVGLDLGLLYDINPSICVGTALYDALASDIQWKGDESDFSRIQPGDKEEIEPSLRVGFTYNLPWKVQYVHSPLLAFDLNEPFDGDITFFKKLHIGAEASLFRDWFKVRIGVSQGYPTIGLSVWSFTYAYYAEESGRHAGQIPDHRHVLCFGL